jgi:hypothetical protein
MPRNPSASVRPVKAAAVREDPAPYAAAAPTERHPSTKNPEGVAPSMPAGKPSALLDTHYGEVMLDQIFGENNFINEIVWKRQSSHNDAKQCSKHYSAIDFLAPAGAHRN